jgi:hypothetical protein
MEDLVTKRIWPLLSLLVVSIWPSLALAHPGHGHTEPDSWQHYLTEPEHLLALAAVVAAIAVAWLLVRRTRRAARATGSRAITAPRE